jgi:hypothetical protein
MYSTPQGAAGKETTMEMQEHTYSVSHKALSEPLVIGSSFPRSERLMKFTAVQYLEANFGNLGWDWLMEMDNMTVTVSVAD